MTVTERQEALKKVLLENLVATTGACVCDGSYVDRGLIDPACGYHEALGTTDDESVDRVLEVLGAGDRHHSMDELYEYRMLYNALAANEWARHGTYPVVKSRFHSDGERPFGKDNLFVVVVIFPAGQVANHYDVEHWDLFQVPEVDLPPEYDGHNPQIAARRLQATLASEKEITHG